MSQSSLTSDLPSQPARISVVTPGSFGPSEPTAARPQQRPAAATTWSGIEIQVFGDLTGVGAQWKEFERKADCTVFQSYNWLAKWQQHIGARTGTSPAIVFGRAADGDLFFIMQFAIAQRGPVRCLTWLGSELCDYNAPLIAADFSQRLEPPRFADLWDEIVKLLLEQKQFGFDLIDLQKMPETVGSQRNPFLSLPTQPHPSGAYIATLVGNWETFYAAKRSSSTRKRERRQLKHLAEHGEVRYVDVQEPTDIARTLEELIAQKSRAFARMGVENIFARPGYREFFLDVATDHNVGTLTHVSRLDVGTTSAAANLGLTFRDSYYLVLSSYHDGELARFGPGRAHLHELMRHAIERGFSRFDFTVGDEGYKRDWSDTELRLYDYLATETARGWIVVALTSAYRRTKRFIKQTPVLWSAFSRLRAWLR
jgi:CelD/BcsL family acetyltransferase involved in cellulose biosynthesis